MRRPSPLKFRPTLRLARLLLASLMACAVLAGAAPSALVYGAHACSMPCCQGAGGDCRDGSCTVGELFPAQAAKPAATPAESDPVCGVDLPTPRDKQTATRAATHAAPAAGHHGHGASPAPHARHAKPHRLAARRVKIEHHHRRHVSERDTASGAAAFTAAVSKPCPPDCGAAPNASTNLRRPREQAALTHSSRPRAPTPAARTRVVAHLTESSSTRRGPCSPRAPPFASVTQSA